MQSDDPQDCEPRYMRLLKLIQQSTGWSHAQIGQELGGYSRHTVMRWMNGQVEPYPGRMVLIERLADKVVARST